MKTGKDPFYRIPFTWLFANMPGKWIYMLFLLLIFGVVLPVSGQEKQLFQIKTFNTNLTPLGNIKISINDKAYVSIGNNGVTFIELSNEDLPVNSVQVENEQLEAASWNLSKGILEIIIRKKNYHTINVEITTADNAPVKNLEVTFRGTKTITTTTDVKGRIELPLGLGESINSPNQFSISGYDIIDFDLSGKNNVLTVEKIRTLPASKRTLIDGQENKKADIQGNDNYFKDFDLSKLDSIQSLTIFYAIFKNYNIEGLDEGIKQKVDAKFNELIGQLQDSVNQTSVSFINDISDSTKVLDDIDNLLSHARKESQMLSNQKVNFGKKIKLVNDKLAKGFGNLDEESRAALLNDLNLLERILTENESRFYKNQNTYREIINNLKDRFFDLEDLENKLSASEGQRLEEQKVFRRRLILISSIVVVFAVLIILLIYFSNKLKKQKRALIVANNEVKRINENLEDIVYERTKLLEATFKELDTVLYRASHDLRSPVCSIIGLCNIATSVSEGEDNELFDRMVQTTVGMDKLLKKLSIISEINQPGDSSQIELCEVVENIRKNFHDIVQDHNINFIVECPKDLTINSIPNLIEVILTNLIENALFYCMVKDSKDYKVVLNASVNEGYLELSLFDNGIGVDSTISDKLFDMFFRGTEHSQGNGLGLYIVQKSVHALNGKISVESEPGQFSKFVVQLPLQLENEAVLELV